MPLTCYCRFLKPRDVSVPPEYLHTPARPDISYSDPSQFNANLDLLNFLANDHADGYTSSLGPNLNPESSTSTISSEVIETSAHRDNSVLLSEFDTTLTQVDEGRTKSKSHRKPLTRAVSCLQEASGNAGVAAEREVRRRKTFSHGEYILSEEFSEKQMAQLQKLATKTAAVQAASTNPSRSLESTILAAFAMTLGRLSSLSYLKKSVNGYRTNEISLRDNLDFDPLRMSPASRIIMINTLDRQIAFQGFLRTFHLYKLVSENRYGLQEIESPFVVNSFERPESPAIKKRGNPRQQQRRQLCKSIMKDFSPDLSEGHVCYEKKYREVLTMRKISHRLNQLVSHFSVGLFGLVPLEGTPEDQLIGLLNHSYVARRGMTDEI